MLEKSTILKISKILNLNENQEKWIVFLYSEH